MDSDKEGTKGGTKTPIADSDSEIEHEPVGEKNVSRQMSESSLYTTEDEEEDETNNKIELGPQCTLKEQFEKDKDDESLRRWKEQLLGSVDINSVGESLDPDVKILSLEIKSPGRPDIVLPIPEDGKPHSPWFTLKEGSKYSLKFSFQVSNNIVTGLKYTNTVWKTGIKVDSTKQMIGAFSPQLEPYTHEMPEDTTPSGMFARGSYSARTKFLDDDNKCYLEINYTFEIKKEWQKLSCLENPRKGFNFSRKVILCKKGQPGALNFRCARSPGKGWTTRVYRTQPYPAFLQETISMARIRDLLVHTV